MSGPLMKQQSNGLQSLYLMAGQSRKIVLSLLSRGGFSQFNSLTMEYY